MVALLPGAEGCRQQAGVQFVARLVTGERDPALLLVFRGARRVELAGGLACGGHGLYLLCAFAL